MTILVLGGAGVRGALYAGAIAALKEKGITISRVIGTSAGAICGAAFCSGKSPEELHRLYRNILPSKILDKRWFPLWTFSGKGKSLVKGNALLSVLRDNLSPTFSDLYIPCTAVAHNYNLRRTDYLSRGDLPLSVRASASLPIFDMVEIGGFWYEDGGVSDNFPVNYSLENYPSERIIGVKIYASPKMGRASSPKSYFSRLSSLAEDILANNMSSNYVSYKNLLEIPLISHIGSMNFNITERDVDIMFESGYETTRLTLDKFWK